MRALFKTHGKVKSAGGSVSISGSFTYRGPRNTVRVIATLFESGRIFPVGNAGPADIPVSESANFLSYSYSLQGKISSTAPSVGVDAVVQAMELQTNSRKQLRHNFAYNIL